MSVDTIWFQSISNSNSDGKLGDMAARVAMQNFEFRFAVLLIFNSTFYYGVEAFLHTCNYSVVINKGDINPKFIKVLRQYVIFGSTATDLEQLLETLRDMEMRNTGKFIIICQSQASQDCDEEEITKLLWQYKIINVVLIKSEEEEKDEALGFTYFPLSDGNCNEVKPVKLISNHSYYLTTHHGTIFGIKLKNLHLCPLFVSTFKQTPYMMIENGRPSGADGDLLRILGYGLNATLKVRTPHRDDGWGFRLKNGTWLGSLADIYEDLANISMTSAALTLSRFSDFQLTRSYHFSYIVWVTHPATLQNEALKLLYPFAASTRISLAISFLFVILCALIAKTNIWSRIIYPERETVEAESRSSRSIVFYSWLICMGQALTKLPTKSSLLQIAMLWIFYCFMLRTMYQVYLIGSLKGTFYEDHFDTIEDAIKENYTFGGGLALQDYYINHPDVFNKWVTIDTQDILPTLFDISKGKKFVFAMNMEIANMFMIDHKVNLHILRQKIVSTPSVIFMKKYSPFAESINLVLSRLVPSGLPAKLHKMYTTIKTERSVKEDELEPLKIIHFTTCYLVLVAGWIASLLFFSLEIYFGRIYKHPTCIT